MTSSGTSDQFDERSTAIRRLTIHYQGEDVLPRDMSRENLSDIQPILDVGMNFFRFLLLLIATGLIVAPWSLAAGLVGA